MKWGGDYEITEVTDDKIILEPHNFEQKSDPSYHWEECSVCGAKKDEAAHEWDAGKVTQEATCTAEGTKLYTCSECSATKEETIQALGHAWDAGTVTKAATCTEDGITLYTCSECGETKDVTIPKDESKHTWDDGTVETPTADKLGGTKYTCTSCGYEYWTGCLTGNMSAPTLMPNGETIYEYCKRNDLLVETNVDVGDGKKLKVLLMDPLGVLKQGENDKLGIEVTYIKEGTDRYNELMSQVDGVHPIEHINFFEVCPTVNGEIKAGELTKNVYMAYEIPEDWDESDLEMILVKDGNDQEFDEKVIEINGKRYLAMWKNHFSPYAMIDELTDEEKAALVAKTGDNSRSVVLTSSAMLIIIGLFLEVCMKKKAKYKKASI